MSVVYWSQFSMSMELYWRDFPSLGALMSSGERWLKHQSKTIVFKLDEIWSLQS